MGGLTFLLCAVMGLMAAPAEARECKAPPGTSGIEQYCEVVPGPGGNRGTSDPGTGGPGVSGPTLRELEQAGVSKRILTRLGSDTKRRGGNRPQDGRIAGPATPAEGGNPLSAVRTAAQDGATSGSGLIWLLLASALTMGALAWRRVRSGEPGQSDSDS